MDDAIKGASRAQQDIGGTVGTYCPACGTSRERSYSVSTRAIGVYCNTCAVFEGIHTGQFGTETRTEAS